MTAQLTSIDAINIFAFGGNATLTLVSKVTGARFTYKIEESDDGKIFFVKVLNGSDNNRDYAYLGHYREGEYTHGRKSRIRIEAASAKAFDFFAHCLHVGKLSANLEVWHEGRCGCCNRKLTVPASIAAGIGPECASKRGIILCDPISDPVMSTLPKKRRSKKAA